MADKKISQLTSSSTPLAGTEVLPIVQSGSTVKVAVSDLTAGRPVTALSLRTPFGSNVAIANALNDNLVIPANAGFLQFTGGGGSAQLGGMSAGFDGQRLVIINATGGNVAIIGESATSSAANRIFTQGLGTATWNNLGTREFIYTTGIGYSRWLMIGSNAG